MELRRITMFTSWGERCGIADYSESLVRALRPHVDVEVIPATFGARAADRERELGERLNGGQVAHVQHSYAFWNGMRPGGGPWELLRAVGVPVVMTVHELDSRITGARGLPPAVEQAYKAWFNRRSFLHPAVRAWVVHSTGLRDELAGLGARTDRVHLLPMPASGPPAGRPDAAAARARFALEGRRVLTLLGFLARRKGYDVAIAALRRLGPEYVLLCAGGEHAADRTGTAAWVRQCAEQAGVADRVRVTGYLEAADLEAALAASDLVLAPFTEMAGSASIHQALAHGRVVVASDLEPNRALPCLALFPAGDAAALAAEVQRLMDDAAARASLAQAAAAYARAHGYEALAEETLRIYRSVLADA